MLTIWTGQSSSGPAMEQRVSTEQGCLVCPQHCSWKGVEDKVSTSVLRAWNRHPGTGTGPADAESWQSKTAELAAAKWLQRSYCLCT